MPAPHPFLGNIKIVVVDDRPDFRLLIAQYLARRGAQVFAAKNAIEGSRLHRISRWPPLILFCNDNRALLDARTEEGLEGQEPRGTRLGRKPVKPPTVLLLRGASTVAEATLA
jgi:hypothetical protein